MAIGTFWPMGKPQKKVWKVFSFPPPIMNSANQDGITILSNNGGAYALFRNAQSNSHLSAGQYVQVIFPRKVIINKLGMLSLPFETDSDNVGRFQFLGWNEGMSPKTLIDSGNGYHPTNSWRDYNINNAEAYKYYQYNFVSSQGGRASGLCGLRYFGLI